MYLREDNTLPTIISATLTLKNEASLLKVLKKYIRVNRWTLANIRGISPSYYMHKIRLEEGKKESIEPQPRLNPAMKKVVKKKILKCLDARVIFLIFTTNG